MSEHRIIRQAIAAKLQSVVGIGNVFEFERFCDKEKPFRDLYAAGASLEGWHIRRVGRREDAANNEVFTDWEIRGFKALADADETELIFDDRIDAINDAFRADPTLGRVVLYPKDDAPVVPELADSGPVMFSGVLCHACKLKLTTRTVDDADRPWD